MIFLSLVYFKSNTISYQNVSFKTQSADITKPKFSINGSNQKISVTANSGNFINADEIMLTNNVIFKSNKFKIYGDNVIFNKNNLVATSKEKSKFISKNALIDSIGFDIIANGNIINFKGKTKITLKWLNYFFFH